jgi:hypothetical protein
LFLSSLPLLSQLCEVTERYGRQRASFERAAARTVAAEIAAMPSAAEVVNELMSIADRPGAAA